MPKIGEVRAGDSASKAEKVAYVKSQRQSREHHCHWPGCEKQVPPAMWGCYQHWKLLPRSLQSRIWAAYRPGQEVSMTPSREYLAVAREVQEWITAYIKGQTENG